MRIADFRRVAEQRAGSTVQKAIRVYTSNEFHDWQRIRLDRRFVIQDIDAWALVVADQSRVAALYELKRARKIPIESWTPFTADRPNYASLFDLATRASLPLYVVYFRRGEPITDTSLFAIFLMEQVEPAFKYQRQVMEAGEFADRFPYPIPP